jgi:hypothetical protein
MPAAVPVNVQPRCIGTQGHRLSDAIGSEAGRNQFAFIAADADMPRARAFRTSPEQTTRTFIRKDV